MHFGEEGGVHGTVRIHDQEKIPWFSLCKGKGEKRPDCLRKAEVLFVNQNHGPVLPGYLCGSISGAIVADHRYQSNCPGLFQNPWQVFRLVLGGQK